MSKGKLIVFEGIYGSGQLIASTVEKLRIELEKQGREVYEIDSPDSGRAQLMGAQELPSSWIYGIFKPDFFFELASRARVCSVIRQELAQGKVVLCNHFTLSSITYARLKGHDWPKEGLDFLESRARGLQFNGEIVPDHTIFVDMTPETALKNLGDRLNDIVSKSDIPLQQKYFMEELAKLPNEKKSIINAERSEAEIFGDALAILTSLLK